MLTLCRIKTGSTIPINEDIIIKIYIILIYVYLSIKINTKCNQTKVC